jgi:hypothetical protein
MPVTNPWPCRLLATAIVGYVRTVSRSKLLKPGPPAPAGGGLTCSGGNFWSGDDVDLNDSPPTIHWINGMPAGVDQGVPFYRELARAGNDGWELVSKDDETWVFKRPKAEG